MPISPQASHWHESVGYQLAQLYVKFTLMLAELTVSLIASYCIASTLVPSHRKPTSDGLPSMTQGLIFCRFCAILVVVMVSGRRR
jgi:hypothetical protein